MDALPDVEGRTLHAWRRLTDQQDGRLTADLEVAVSQLHSFCRLAGSRYDTLPAPTIAGRRPAGCKLHAAAANGRA